MIVKVKEIPVRHNGRQHLANDEFEIDPKEYEKIKKFVDVVEDAPSENQKKKQSAKE